MKLHYLLAIALLLGLTGCDRALATFDAPNSLRYDVPGLDAVREFRLSDGTRCVAINGTGISCEWQHPVILVPRPQ